MLHAQGAGALITGTLGLAYPDTAAAMKRAVQEVKAGGGTVGTTCFDSDIRRLQTTFTGG